MYNCVSFVLVPGDAVQIGTCSSPLRCVGYYKLCEYMRLLKAGLLRYKELQLPKICRGTEIVRMNSNNPRSPLETNYR